jgi:uncharacterized SAM-dependent methyltransferase
MSFVSPFNSPHLHMTSAGQAGVKHCNHEVLDVTSSARMINVLAQPYCQQPNDRNSASRVHTLIPQPTTRDIPSFKVLVLLTEQEIAAEFAAAMAQGFLDEKFFYWLPTSVKAWVDLCSSTEYRNANRALKLIESSAAELARRWAEVDALCGVGCGEGSKDVPLLAAFAAAGRQIDYIAADFSQPLLELACGSALAAGARRATGVKFDVGSDAQLCAAADVATGGNRIFSVLGNTLGAFGPAQFPARLHKIMKANDRALFDGEIFAGEETLRGYDNPINRKFAFAPLAGLGLVEGRDGDLVFELRSGRDGIHEVAKYFIPARNMDLNVAGHDVALAGGKKLLMSGSIKYEAEAFHRVLRDGGFTVDFSVKAPDGKFLLAGVQKTT